MVPLEYKNGISLQAFDDLLLMKVGGQVTYHGHLGKQSRSLIRYFEAIPGVPRCREGLNPATWMLQISTPAMEKRIGVNFADHFAISSAHQYVFWCLAAGHQNDTSVWSFICCFLQMCIEQSIPSQLHAILQCWPPRHLQSDPGTTGSSPCKPLSPQLKHSMPGRS